MALSRDQAQVIRVLVGWTDLFFQIAGMAGVLAIGWGVLVRLRPDRDPPRWGYKATSIASTAAGLAFIWGTVARYLFIRAHRES